MTLWDVPKGIIMRKLNCWEYKRCSHGQGERPAQRNFCPAMSIPVLNGVHGGSQGGRSCWVVKDTLCGGRKSGVWSAKINECRSCGFYGMVMQEEGIDFMLLSALHDRIERGGDLNRDGYASGGDA